MDEAEIMAEVMDAYKEKFLERIKYTDELFSAVQTVGNRAVSTVGYNQSYTFASGLTVSYELYTDGPAVPYGSQYSHLNKEMLGEQINREPGISDEQWCLEKEKLFCRIVIKDSDTPVFILQGKNEFRCALHVDGPWEEKLLAWFRADGGILR